jgi:hypothetical protein
MIRPVLHMVRFEKAAAAAVAAFNAELSSHMEVMYLYRRRLLCSFC